MYCKINFIKLLKNLKIPRKVEKEGYTNGGKTKAGYY